MGQTVNKKSATERKKDDKKTKIKSDIHKGKEERREKSSKKAYLRYEDENVKVKKRRNVIQIDLEVFCQGRYF